ncbi:protein of unknown function [Hyphomicrobium sp. MC1]|nr:protein of unknown function [Hyphomicrobium sp. MC1]
MEQVLGDQLAWFKEKD